VRAFFISDFGFSPAPDRAPHLACAKPKSAIRNPQFLASCAGRGIFPARIFMSEIPKTYEPAAIEAKWYADWENKGCFFADPKSPKPAYSIVIPPPNVTGVLTLGHVLNNTIQDILARRARMTGHEVLWLPGTDHAGIATQNVVEKALRKEGAIKHRDDLGREALVGKIWEWKDKYGGIILKQLRALGASCDWSRTRFTMDPEYSACVSRIFVDLYKKGLIYRGKRMVNWCPASLTALSDEEVIMKEQNGFMYHFRVEVVEKPGTFLTIATTRPETIPADTAVAVNPKDERYQHLIGLHVYRALPLDQPKHLRKIPIIADDQVAFDFGTGVLKVTPAHDKVDYEIGVRHKLPILDILTPDGKMTADAGADLAGLDRFAARKKAAEILEEAGALEKAEPYKNNVGYSERAEVPIEPRLSEQWFLKYPSVEEAKACVAEGKMRFFPDRWAKVYDHWLEGIQDWCISRQVWWGHRVPVWNRGDEVHCAVEAPSGEGWTQDPDVLDTWFSSWLWPFATMGWPDKTETLAKFYPTTDLVTGPDIIFFWVARMIMAGYEWMGELPFKNVYFTGIIRDKQGRKMSKSLGNSPDPLDLIASFGADALRFGVMRSAPLGADILFDEKNVELGRNFCTKIWNAARFRQMQEDEASGGKVAEAEIRADLLTSDDKWILLRLDAAITTVTKALEEYRFSDAANALYTFFWGEYCDWYLEASKASLQSTEPGRKENTLAVMDFVFSHTLRLFHPFLPFITEELWQSMGFAQDMPPKQGGETIMFAPWPQAFTPEEREYFILDESDEQYAAAKFEVVNRGRALRRDCNIASNKRVRFILKPQAPLPAHEALVLKLLLNAEQLEVDAAYTAPKGTPTALTPLGELFLPLDGLIDVDAERDRLDKELTKVGAELDKVRAKLADENFAAKVPAKVLEDHQKRERDWADKHAQLTKMREALG
jgi:valyl-tRNA synthetase